jgi:hypothetical protein
MIYCWKCGRKNKDSAEVCYKCGEKLFAGEEEEEEKPKPKFGLGKKIFVFIIFILIIGLVATWFLNQPVQNNPKIAVQGFIQSLEIKNLKRALLYIDRDIWNEAEGEIAKWEKVKEIKFSDLQIETISESGDNANVQAKGKIESEISGFKKENRFDQKIDLIKKQGRWYITTIPDFL